MKYSGVIATSGTGNVTAIAATTPALYSNGGYVWNDIGSAAGQFSIDNGFTWIDFAAGPASLPLPPKYQYTAGVLVRRAQGSDSGASEPDVTSFKVWIWD